MRLSVKARCQSTVVGPSVDREVLGYGSWTGLARGRSEKGKSLEEPGKQRAVSGKQLLAASGAVLSVCMAHAW
jgi:hypothetical protein